MKVGVLKYPGGHGDAELLTRVGHLTGNSAREVWYKEETYQDLDLIIIGGGFPCVNEDEGNQCIDKSPALNYLYKFAASGKLVVAFGNGFRLLCEAGLLPGKILQNQKGRFISKQVFLKAENHSNLLTAGLSPERIFKVPVATDYGNFAAGDEELMRMRKEEQILFRYCDSEGRITEAVNFTGSTGNIAAISNRNKNVFGMIPLPDRSVDVPDENTGGLFILRKFFEQLNG